MGSFKLISWTLKNLFYLKTARIKKGSYKKINQTQTKPSAALKPRKEKLEII